MSIMPLSEFSGEKNESRDNRVMRWRELIHANAHGLRLIF